MASSLQLRPHDQHRPSQSRPGGTGGGALRLVALTLAATLAGGAFLGCGNGSDDKTPNATNTAAPQARDLKAADVIPDLTSLGFTLGQSGRDPAALPGQDVHRALFQQAAAPQMSARIDVTVMPGDKEASTYWDALSKALRNPPPDLFGGDSTQKDSAATGVGDQSKAYVTAKPDVNGTQVWTDVYRFGRVVAVVQVLSRNEAEALKARPAIAAKVQERAR